MSKKDEQNLHLGILNRFSSGEGADLDLDMENENDHHAKKHHHTDPTVEDLTAFAREVRELEKAARINSTNNEEYQEDRIKSFQRLAGTTDPKIVEQYMLTEEKSGITPSGIHKDLSQIGLSKSDPRNSDWWTRGSGPGGARTTGTGGFSGKSDLEVTLPTGCHNNVVITKSIDITLKDIIPEALLKKIENLSRCEIQYHEVEFDVEDVSSSNIASNYASIIPGTGLAYGSDQMSTTTAATAENRLSVLPDFVRRKTSIMNNYSAPISTRFNTPNAGRMLVDRNTAEASIMDRGAEKSDALASNAHFRANNRVSDYGSLPSAMTSGFSAKRSIVWLKPGRIYAKDFAKNPIWGNRHEPGQDKKRLYSLGAGKTEYSAANNSIDPSEFSSAKNQSLPKTTQTVKFHDKKQGDRGRGGLGFRYYHENPFHYDVTHVRKGNMQILAEGEDDSDDQGPESSRIGIETNLNPGLSDLSGRNRALTSAETTQAKQMMDFIMDSEAQNAGLRRDLKTAGHFAEPPSNSVTIEELESDSGGEKESSSTEEPLTNPQATADLREGDHFAVDGASSSSSASGSKCTKTKKSHTEEATKSSTKFSMQTINLDEDLDTLKRKADNHMVGLNYPNGPGNSSKSSSYQTILSGRKSSNKEVTINVEADARSSSSSDTNPNLELAPMDTIKNRTSTTSKEAKKFKHLSQSDSKPKSSTKSNLQIRNAAPTASGHHHHGHHEHSEHHSDHHHHHRHSSQSAKTGEIAEGEHMGMVCSKNKDKKKKSKEISEKVPESGEGGIRDSAAENLRASGEGDGERQSGAPDYFSVTDRLGGLGSARAGGQDSNASMKPVPLIKEKAEDKPPSEPKHGVDVLTTGGKHLDRLNVNAVKEYMKKQAQEAAEIYKKDATGMTREEDSDLWQAPDWKSIVAMRRRRRFRGWDTVDVKGQFLSFQTATSILVDQRK